MHKISMHLPRFQSFFTPYYCDGFVKFWLKLGILEFTVMGGTFLRRTIDYLKKNKLAIDCEGRHGPYDLVVTCSDLIVPKNILGSKLVLVQEGMTDPEGILYYLVKYLKLPRWLASTSTTGLSEAYDVFCVASEGYREFFRKKGINTDKIRVTGIPNYDYCDSLRKNKFPHKNYVLVATSDRREIYRYENRRKLIRKANKIANGRQIIFKFHPNEKVKRARREVERYSPAALIYADGNTDHMVANCDTLVTRFSSVAFVAMALGKKVYSDIPLDQLHRLLPIQNEGRSAYNIAAECLKLFDPVILHTKNLSRQSGYTDRYFGAQQSG